jgi:hypothetical protein
MKWEKGSQRARLRARQFGKTGAAGGAPWRQQTTDDGSFAASSFVVLHRVKHETELRFGNEILVSAGPHPSRFT